MIVFSCLIAGGEFGLYYNSCLQNSGTVDLSSAVVYLFYNIRHALGYVIDQFSWQHGGNFFSAC